MGKRILLADDSITIQKVIELTFSDEDFEVVTVGNGRLAIEKLEEIRPDIVLCDIIMPEKDGYEVCDFVKKHPALSNVPVLLLTGAFEPFDQERAARVGCDGFLAKPFEPAMLIGKVRDLLSHAAARPSAPAPVSPPAPAPAYTPLASPEPLMFPTEPSPVPEEESATAARMAGPAGSFIPDEPVMDQIPEAAAFEEVAPASEEAGAASVLEQEFYGAGEPVEAAPDDFLPVSAEEAETLSAGTADASSTVVFRASDAPWVGHPTLEVPLEARARAAVEAQAPPPAPAFEEVFDEDMPVPAVSVPPRVPETVTRPTAPPPEPPAEPLFKAPAQPGEAPVADAVPDLPEEVSFADVTPMPVAATVPAPPSGAAELTVPVEMVAQIAQRVVAQISEKVVREVAWEVIPDLAEALIKKEIERLKAELQNT